MTRRCELASRVALRRELRARQFHSPMPLQTERLNSQGVILLAGESTGRLQAIHTNNVGGILNEPEPESKSQPEAGPTAAGQSARPAGWRAAGRRSEARSAAAGWRSQARPAGRRSQTRPAGPEPLSLCDRD